MSSYRAVHVFRPSFTRPDPDNPGKRVLLTSSNYAYRFAYRGRQFQRAGFKTATLARQAGEARKQEVVAGLEDDWRKFSILGLYQLAKARQAQNDESTQQSFEHVWKRIRAKLPDHTYVVDVDDTRLLELLTAWKAEGLAQNTIRLTFEKLRTAMLLANKKRRLPWVPEFPRVKYQRREQTLHPVQLAQITRHMAPHYRLFLEAAQEVGWRARSELASRKLEHVDFGPATWLCECGQRVTADECACGAGRPGWLELDAASNKTDQARAFPMTKKLRAILSEAVKFREDVQRRTGTISPWLFCRSDGGQIRNYKKAWATACERAGIGKVDGRTGPWSSKAVVHDLRRTWIRRAKKLGLDRDARKGLVGHTSDQTHGIYEARGADAESLRAAALQLDRARDQETPKVETIRKGVSER